MKMTKAIPAVAMQVVLMFGCVAATEAIPQIANDEVVQITTESVWTSNESFMRFGVR